MAKSRNTFFSFYGGIKDANLQIKHLIKVDSSGNVHKIELSEIKKNFPNVIKCFLGIAGIQDKIINQISNMKPQNCNSKLVKNSETSFLTFLKSCKGTKKIKKLFLLNKSCQHGLEQNVQKSFDQTSKVFPY